MPNGKILIVDDERIVREPWRRALQLAKYQVWTAENASQALKLCDEVHFDLVILDFLMPPMDGVELLHRIRQKLPHVRSIIVSGKIADEVSAKDLTLSLKEAVESDAYRHKPISNPELLELIESLLRSGDDQRNWQEIASEAIASKKFPIKRAKEASKKLKRLVKKRTPGDK